MLLSGLEQSNHRTLDALRTGKIGPGDCHDYPYFGYFQVDIFECPPFLMFTNNDMPAAVNILYAKAFEKLSTKLWARLLPQASSVLDIGASVGVYSLIAAALRKDIKIHAFEPNPHAYTRLRLHKLVNHFNHIAEHPVALGMDDGACEFSWLIKRDAYISSGGVVRRLDGPQYERTVVPLQKLDGTGLAATLGPRPLVKVDVEGVESTVFKGMNEVIALKPDIIVETFNEKFCERINATLLPWGYRVYSIDETTDQMSPCEKLLSRTRGANDMNHLLTTRPPEEIAALMA